MTGHPTQVDAAATHIRNALRIRRIGHPAVNGGVIDLHDLAIEIDAIGDIDDVLEDLADDLRHRRLAIAGGPVNENRVAGIDRRAQPTQKAIGHDQTCETLLESLAGHMFVGDALALNAILIVLQRHRRRSEILASLHGVVDEFTPRPRQGQPQFSHRAAGGGHRQRLHELSILGFLQDLVDDVAGQFQGVGDLRRGLELFRVHALHRQLEQHGGIDAGGCRSQRRLRRFVEGLVDLFLGEQAKRDDAVAKPSAVLGLMLERPLDVRRGEETLRHQEFAHVHAVCPCNDLLTSRPERPALPRTITLRLILPVPGAFRPLHEDRNIWRRKTWRPRGITCDPWP